MKKVVVISLLAVLVLAGCGNVKDGASTPKIKDVLKEQTGQNGRACVRISDINGYGYQNNVITIDGRRNYYLATTVMRCNAMNTAVAARFEGPSGYEICGGGSSKIRSGGDTCTISQIFEFESREVAFAALDTADTKLKELQEAVKAE
jgi:hypothetical protein